MTRCVVEQQQLRMLLSFFERSTDAAVTTPCRISHQGMN